MLSCSTSLTSRRLGTARLALLAPAMTALLAAVASGQTFSNMGVLQADHHFSQGLAVSSNGAVVVGDSSPEFFQGEHGFRWTLGGGMQDIGALPEAINTFAMGVNADGSAIAGACYTADRDHAFRWTATGGLQDLGSLPGAMFGATASGISADGGRVAGTSSTPDGSFHPFLWTPGAGMQDLGVLPGGDYAFGFAISRNGAAVTGLSTTASAAGPIEHTFVWTVAAGMQDLGAVNADEPSAAFAINADGSVVAGYSGSFAARWVNGHAQNLGMLPGGTFSAAYSIDGTGQIVGGFSDNAAGDLVATLWIPSLGCIDLNTILPRIGVDLTGWHLEVATAISEDGTTITGGGTLNGESRGWVVRIPAHGKSVIGTLTSAARRPR